MSTTAVGICAFPITKIVTHTNPHIDEICGIWLLRKFGHNHFPGIREASLEFWSNGNASINMTAEEYLKQGILQIGIGGGMFDEHPTLDSERKKDRCAATLIAEYIGVDDDPSLELILEFVQKNDLNGNASMFDIGSLCLTMYAVMPTERVMLWATLALEATFSKQEQFHKEAKEEYTKARIFTVPKNGDRAIKVAVIQSDNPVVAKFARSAQGGNNAIVIQKQSTGNVQIFLNRRFGWVKFQNIVKFIRLAEQKAKNRFETLKDEDLVKEGTVPGAEEWHFFKKGQMLLNGSLSHPGVPATKIPLEEITRIVCNCAH